MEHYGHEAFYEHANSSSSLLGGNLQDQSNQAYSDDWSTSPGEDCPPQSAAPPPPHSDPDGALDAFPLAEPGSLITINPLTLQNLNPVPLYSTSVNLKHLENLDSLVDDQSRTHDSSYYTSTQGDNPHYSTAPTDFFPQHTYLNPVSYGSPFYPNSHMTQSISAPSQNDPQLSPDIEQHRVSMEKRISQDSMSSVASKRTRDVLESSGHDDYTQRTSKAPRLDDGRIQSESLHPDQYMDPRPMYRSRSDINHQLRRHPSQVSHMQTRNIRLSNKQKSFIRQWYEDFANGQASSSYLASEQVNALATLLRVPVQPVMDYINKKYINPSNYLPANSDFAPTSGRAHDPKRRPPFQPDYSLTEANQHLHSTTLSLVERYVQACQRRRAQNDGRRSVNDGPFRCTFGCGYRTKRAFDWRRHEETHEPQELWLCLVCSQKGEQNPFLVNRKDKFLKHAKDAHKDGWEPEVVLEMSRVDFRGTFDPQCPNCPTTSDTWDDRCRHILGHYEDEANDSSRKLDGRAKPGSRFDSASNEDRSDPAEGDSSSDSSDDDDNHPAFHKGPNKRDRTGGSGGGSGNLGGNSSGSGGDPGSYSGPTGQQDSYGSYPQSGYQGWQQSYRSNGKFNLSTSTYRLSTPNSQFSSVPILASLGHGSHGSVDVVQEYRTGQLFARKHKAFAREIKLLKGLVHPHIVRFVTSYSQHASLHLIMIPVADINLQTYMAGPHTLVFDLNRTHAWIGCLSSALAYIHSQRIRHADVKPANILLRGQDLFISDFGISRLVSEPDSTSSSNCPSTPLYSPLEISEQRVHGRKADVFSLGCVVLELLSRVQGKTIQDLHQHLGLAKRDHSASRDKLAYYKTQSKITSWISTMQRQATTTTRCLWQMCERMVQNRMELRPSAASLLQEVGRILQEGDVPECHECALVSSWSKEMNPVQHDAFISLPAGPSPVTTNPLEIGCLNKGPQPILLPPATPSDQKAMRPKDELRKDSCSIPPRRTLPTQSCSCTVKKKRSSNRVGLFNILLEYERASCNAYQVDASALRSYKETSLSPPAYDDAAFIPVATWPSQHHVASEARYAAQEGVVGKVGTQTSHETRQCRPPRVRAQPLCHRCGTGFVAARLDTCRKCLHIRCLRCTEPPNTRGSWEEPKAESVFTAIGSHLQPPAYSVHDDSLNAQSILAGVSTHDPLVEVHKETIVLELVIADSSHLGNDPVETFIQSRPSTFDRIHSSIGSSNLSLLSHEASITSNITQLQPLPPTRYSLSPTSRTLSSPTVPQPKRSTTTQQPCSIKDRAPTHLPPRLNRRKKDRQFISGRSKQTVHLKKHRAMTDHNDYTTKLNSQELTSKLERVQRSDSSSDHGVDFSRGPRISRSRTASSDPSDIMSRLPRFRKADTTSTMDSTNSISRLEVVRTIPSSVMSRESAEVEPGEFSKPTNMFKRRRESSGGEKGRKEFQYYGRHANSWLFNDFSVTDTVKKGWKALSGKEEDGTEE